MEPQLYFDTGLRVKAVSSCLRNASAWARQLRMATLSDVLHQPAEGDLVVARVSGDQGVYLKMEAQNDREIPLYPNDVIVGVLGTRMSGTSPSGTLPSIPLRRRDRLSLIAAGGILGHAIAIPAYCGTTVLPLEILGFPQLAGESLNLRQHPLRHSPAPLLAGNRMLFVAATSAESGKTTCIGKITRSLLDVDGNSRISAIKVVGTGRRRDILSVRDAGARFIADFVDAGWPTTYNMLPDTYDAMLDDLLRQGSAGGDFLLTEIGGDLFEGNADRALRKAVDLGAHVVLIVNDALGAYGGLAVLKQYGARTIHVASMRQNVDSLAHRLGLPRAYDLLNPADMSELLGATLLAPQAAHAR